MDAYRGTNDIFRYQVIDFLTAEFYEISLLISNLLQKIQF